MQLQYYVFAFSPKLCTLPLAPPRLQNAPAAPLKKLQVPWFVWGGLQVACAVQRSFPLLACWLPKFGNLVVFKLNLSLIIFKSFLHRQIKMHFNLCKNDTDQLDDGFYRRNFRMWFKCQTKTFSVLYFYSCSCTRKWIIETLICAAIRTKSQLLHRQSGRFNVWIHVGASESKHHDVSVSQK